MIKTYPSKVSYGLLTFIFLVFYGPLIPVLVNGELNVKLIGILVFLTLIFTFIVHLFLKTYYTIDKDQLKIKCGVFSYKSIDITDIKEISSTNNILASPAPSFERIEIKYGTFDEIILSPNDKIKFANDLKMINPNIKNNITS